jgi:hypothetical protein
MWTAEFWKATAERSIKTFAQAWAAVLVANGTGILDTEWTAGLSVAGMAALLSVLTSVGSAGVGNPGPSLATEALHDQV